MWGLEDPFHICPVGVVVFHVFTRTAFGLLLLFGMARIIETAGSSRAGGHNGGGGQGNNQQESNLFHGYGFWFLFNALIYYAYIITYNYLFVKGLAKA